MDRLDFPPLDPDADREADGERERQRDYLRRKLAEGQAHPARQRMMRHQLRELERQAA